MLTSQSVSVPNQRTRAVPGTKQKTVMKTNFTFNELSKIFAAVAKIDVLMNEQVCAEAAYEKKDRDFDVEFSYYGYTFINAPQELHTMFDEKCRLMDERDKSQRRTFKAIKDFAAIAGVGSGCREWFEDTIKDYIAGKHYWNAEKAARYCKSLAVIIANRVR